MKKFLFMICMAFVPSLTFAQTIEPEEAQRLQVKAKEVIANVVELVGTVAAPAGEMITDEGKANALAELRRQIPVNSRLINDLDVKNKTSTTFSRDEYFGFIDTYYPNGAEFVYDVEKIKIGDVCFDANKDYFVKIEVTRSIIGYQRNKGNDEPVNDTQTLDFYVQLSKDGKIYEKSMPVNSMTFHRENTSFTKVPFGNAESSDLIITKQQVTNLANSVDQELANMKKLNEKYKQERDIALKAAEEAIRAQKFAEEQHDELKDKVAFDAQGILKRSEDITKKWSAWQTDKWSVNGNLERVSHRYLTTFQEKNSKLLGELENNQYLKTNFAALLLKYQSNLNSSNRKIKEVLDKPNRLKDAKFFNKIVDNNKRLVIKLSYGMAAVTNNLSKITSAPVSMINAHIGYRFLGKSRKRGHTFGAFGSFGQANQETVNYMIKTSSAKEFSIKNQKYDFFEVGAGFMFFECLRLSGGYGVQNVTDSKNLSTKIEYGNVTTGISISHRRFLEFDIYATTLFNDKLASPVFRIGASLGIVLRTADNKKCRSTPPRP